MLSRAISWLNGHLSIIVVVILQAIGILIWGVHLTDNVYDGQKMDAQIIERVNELSKRIDQLDNNGTRKLTIVEDRQNSVLKRLDSIEQRVYNVEQRLK